MTLCVEGGDCGSKQLGREKQRQGGEELGRREEPQEKQKRSTFALQNKAAMGPSWASGGAGQGGTSALGFQHPTSGERQQWHSQQENK